MGTPMIPSVDSDTKQFPDSVRQRIAQNLADLSTPEGAATASGSAAGAGRAVSDSRVRLASMAAYDLAITMGKTRVAIEDSDQFIENWTDLSAWVGTGAQAVGGSLYGGTTSQSSGINHALRVEPSGIARITFQVNFVSGATAGQGILVGFSKATTGAAPTAGGAASRGLYFRSGTDTTHLNLNSLDSGAQTNLLDVAVTSDTYIVTATVDESFLTLTAFSPATNTEVHAKWPRDDSATPLNNLTIMANDSRGTAGSSVSTVTARRGGLVTTKPRVASRTVHWGAAGGDNFRIALPPTYDSRMPCPAVILFHGNGSDESHWITNGNGKAVDTALLNAGFITIAAANTGNVSTWGSDDGLAAYTNAYRYARDHYNIGSVSFYANSMGSIESLNVLARDAIPGVAAWAGTSPTYDLAENRANALFTTTIDAAYGGNYATNAVGHDPAKMNARLFRSIPMWMLIPTDDVSVTPSANGLALYAAVSPFVPTTKFEVTGGHSTGQIATKAPDIAAWFKSVLGIS